MPIPIIIWAGVGIAGIVSTAWAAGETGDAIEKSGDAAAKAAELAKWVTIGGAIYASYAALKSTGVLK